jgi:hypothetical protein
MDWNLKKMWPVAAASLVAFTSLLSADDAMQNRQMRGDKSSQSDRSGRKMDDRRDDRRDGKDNMAPSDGRWRDVEMCCDNQGPCNLPLAYTPNASCWYPSDCECGGWFDNLSLSVSALYWKACEDGLAYAVDNEDLVEASVINHGEMEYPGSKWSWGFKVGLGFDFEHDGWDLQANWTWFRTRHHDDETDETGNLYPMYSALATAAEQLSATEAEARWRIRLNMIDLELGRAFFTSRWLTLRPHMGLRGAWIKQSYDIEYETLNSTFPVVASSESEVDMKNKFWGVGIRGGLDTRWGFCGNWSIYGNMAISILYGRFHIDHEEEAANSAGTIETNVINFHDHFCAARAITDLALGLMWEHTFCGCEDICAPDCYGDNGGSSRRSPEKPGYHLSVMLGWEQHIFFNQNQFWRVSRTSTPSGHHQAFGHERGDLTTQGVTLTARLGF